MDPSATPLDDLFTNPVQFVIPHYQRGYQWGRELWSQLILDLSQLNYAAERRPDSEEIHFLGFTISKIQNEFGRSRGEPKKFHLIDGQQRFITLLLLELAVCDAQVDLGSEPGRPSFAFDFQGNQFSKIVVSAEDQSAWNEFTSNRHAWRQRYLIFNTQQESVANKFERVYRYFRSQLHRGYSLLRDEAEQTEENGATDQVEATKKTLPEVWRFLASQRTAGWTAEQLWDDNWGDCSPFSASFLSGMQTTMLNRFQILDFQLSTTDPAGAQLFKTVNTHRKPLEQWDFLRNDLFIAMGDTAEADAIYTELWLPTNTRLSSTKYEAMRGSSTDVFLYDYLVARREIFLEGYFNRNRTASAYEKRFNREVRVNNVASVKAFLGEDLFHFAESWIEVVQLYRGELHHSIIELSDADTVSLKESVELLGKFSAGPLLPLIAHLHELARTLATAESSQLLLQCLGVTESFIVRYTLSGRPLSPLRAHINDVLNSDSPVTLDPDALRARLVGPAKESWAATDRDIRTYLSTMPVYSTIGGQVIAAVFRGIERSMVREMAHPMPYGTIGLTLDHIFPQRPAKVWRDSLVEWLGSEELAGTELEKLIPSSAEQLKMVDFMGNLALVKASINQSMTNSMPFLERRDIINGDVPCDGDYNPQLTVNRKYLTEQSRWTSDEIVERSERLAEHVCQAWPD